MTSDDIDDPDLVGLRGDTRYGPRWRPVGLRLNAAGRAFEEGNLDGALRYSEESLTACADAIQLTGNRYDASDVRSNPCGVSVLSRGVQRLQYGPFRAIRFWLGGGR